MFVVYIIRGVLFDRECNVYTTHLHIIICSRIKYMYIYIYICVWGAHIRQFDRFQRETAAADTVACRVGVNPF